MKLGETIRSYTAFTVTFPSGSPTSNPFALAIQGQALGNMFIPSGFTGFGLGAQIGTAAAALVGLKDKDNAYGTDVSIVMPTAQLVAAEARPMPDYWFGAGFVALWSHDGTGSGMPQTSARVVTIEVVS